MVFHCRCFSFQEYEYETRPRSTTTQTFYSDFHPDSQEKASVFSNLSQKTSNLRVFTLAELKAATKNFCRDSKIGKGGVGIVYRGVIKSLEHPFDEIQVAVKFANGELQGHREWVTEVNVLGVVQHPNLVKLLGYCSEDEETSGTQRLLVYEFMRNGSVADHLSTSSKAPLSWNMRLKVAQDAACGLAYLHEGIGMDFQIIFGDVTSSNILLDDQWNAKLSDFGFARLGPEEGLTLVLNVVGGTMVYAAPEYIKTGHLTSTCDVWSYGVFLYELITGRNPLDWNKQDLLEWVKPYIGSERVQVIVDPRVLGNYSLESAQKLSLIANRCVTIDPKSRPRMSEVLEMVNQLITGVPSQAVNPPPPKSLSLSLVRVVAIKLKKVLMCTTKYEKTHKDTKNKGEIRPRICCVS